MQCVVSQATNYTKIKLADNIWVSPIVFPFFFLYNILALSSRVKDNKTLKVTLMNHDIMQQSYPDLYV